VNLGHGTVAVDADDLVMVVRQGRVAEEGRRWSVESVRGRDTDGQPGIQKNIGFEKVRKYPFLLYHYRHLAS